MQEPQHVGPTHTEPGRGINVIERGEVIEDYPTDARGHRCLMSGLGADRRWVHVVCAPKDDYLAVITALI